MNEKIFDEELKKVIRYRNDICLRAIEYRIVFIISFELFLHICNCLDYDQSAS